MAKTREQITRRALEDLGVVASGQDVAAEDVARIDIDATVARLADERVADLAAYVTANDLPDGMFLHFCKIVAADHAASFGVPPDLAAAMRADGEAGLKLILRRSRPILQLQVPRIIGW